MREVIDINVSAEMQSVTAALEVLGSETRLSVYTLLVPAGRSGLTIGNVQKKLVIPVLNFSRNCCVNEATLPAHRHKDLENRARRLA